MNLFETVDELEAVQDEHTESLDFEAYQAFDILIARVEVLANLKAGASIESLIEQYSKEARDLLNTIRKQNEN